VTVFALIMTGPLPAAHIEELAAGLGLVGADRLLICEGPHLDAPALDATHGRALLTAAERIPPILVLFPAGGPGDELGPSLAARLGGAFGPAVDVEVSEQIDPLADGVGRLRLCRWRADHSGMRRLDPVEIERPVIAILGAHGEPNRTGTRDIDVEVIVCAPPAAAPVVELASQPDEHDAIKLARGLILSGPAVDARLVARLQAAAPRGVVVVDSRRVSPAALASSSPEAVLELGRGAPAVGVSPRTRLGRVELADDETTSPGGGAGQLAPDLIWRPHPADDPWTELEAALRSLAAAGATARAGQAGSGGDGDGGGVVEGGGHT
jgi:hypothetical protein